MHTSNLVTRVSRTIKTDLLVLVLGIITTATGYSAFAGDIPIIVSREEWGAKTPTMTMKKNIPERITIHHSAIRQNTKISLKKKLQSLQIFSQHSSKLANGKIKKAWADVPYHYYIDLNGDIGEGRAIDRVGDTNTDYDPGGHISIVLEGNFEKDNPTSAQAAALESLLVYLVKKYRIDIKKIGWHKQYAKTACPGANLVEMLPDIIVNVERRL